MKKLKLMEPFLLGIGILAATLFVSAPVIPVFAATLPAVTITSSTTPTVTATFTDAAGQTLVSGGTVAVGSAIVVHPASTGISHPFYQLWVETPGTTTFVDQGGYTAATAAGVSIPVTTPGTYQINLYGSASVAGTNPVEAAPYTFTAKSSN